MDFVPSPPFRPGATLAVGGREHHVFRAAVFSIVLTLAVGQNAALLCKAWCYPHEAPAAGCRHHEPTTSATVNGNDNCSGATFGAIAFVREDARRTASAQDAQNGLAVPRFRFVPSHSNSPFGYESGQPPPLQARPLAIALRI